MSLLATRVAGAINRHGMSVVVGSTSTKALLRPLNMSQLQTYVTSGTFASWLRPVYAAILPPTAEVAPEDDFEGPDFDGEIRQVNLIRVAGSLVAKMAIVSRKPDVAPPGA